MWSDKVQRPPGTLWLGKIVNGGGFAAVDPEARLRHLYIVGGTGTGKSKLLETLIRQDILDQRRTGSGLLLLDPHGNLYDAILRWLTAHQEELKRPIVLVDMRRDDVVLAYNLLRRRQRPDGSEAAPTVVIDNFIQAMAHAWGVAGTDETPLLARWASAVMQALYERHLTLAEALLLTDRVTKDIREHLTEDLRDPVSRGHWEYSLQMRKEDFDLQMTSSINRLERFLRNPLLRSMFGQAEVSFDFSEALEKGHIVLVNLATEGSKISKENARVVGTVMLTDLWHAAEQRGKRDEGRVKPFSVYVDEFQHFITPTIAENLDEARGFGLRLAMAHQFPTQLSLAGPHGERLLDSIMENAKTKVVFCLESEPNLRLMAEWLFRGTMDPDEVKHTLRSTKVMDYHLEYKKAYSRTETSTSGGARHRGSASGFGDSGGATHSVTTGIDAEGNVIQTVGDTNIATWNAYFADNYGDDETWGDASARTESDVPMLIPEMGQEDSAVQFRSLEEQIFRAMAVLFDQQQRQAVVRIHQHKTPMSIFTPFVREAIASPPRVERHVGRLHATWPFVLQAAEATRRLEARQRSIEAEVRASNVSPREPPCVRIEALDSMTDPMTFTGDNGKSVVLQPRDLALLADVFDNRFITITHAQRLHFGDVSRQAVEKRLRELTVAGLLATQATDLQTHKTIYRPTRKAVEALSTAGALVNINDDDWDARLRKRYTGKIGSLKHELAVLDVKAALGPAIRNAPGSHLRLMEFGIWPSPYKFPRPPGARRRELEPDGFLHVREHLPSQLPRDVYFYVELDHASNERRDDLLDKIDAYKHHLDSGGFAQWLGVPSASRDEATFRVLFIILSADADRRLDNVLKRVCDRRPTINSLPWFTTLDTLRSDPLGSVWLTPSTYRDSTATRRPLFEGLTLPARDSSSHSGVVE